MAVYDPSQPLWKRNVAGILDFLLAFIVFAVLASKILGSPPPRVPVVTPAGTTATEIFGFGGLPSLVALVLVIAYFVILGRTGGTVFQRLFGMKRAK
jgi:RDD family